MEILHIQGYEDIPKIFADAGKGLIEITGKSTHENPIEIYALFHEWLRAYALKPQLNTVVEVHLDYFNTSSSKCLLDAFKILEHIHLEENKAQVVINWYYKSNDLDLMEAGEDYQDMIKIPFKLLSIEL